MEMMSNRIRVRLEACLNTRFNQSLKRVLSLTLLAALVLSLLSGCGNGKKGEVAEQIYVATVSTEREENAGIFVEPIEGLDGSFMLGADISSLLSEEESGVKYYDADGNEKDLFELLAEGGVNWIRVRVWNDPFDSKGHGYGGGNVDAKRAAEIGRRAAEYGMKLLVDFHYSDFWADPNKQMAPKKWENMKLDAKVSAIESYTEKALTQILNAGADVGMVQIGNEINNGMAGETKEENVLTLLSAASGAVRSVAADYGRDIKIAVHYTNADDPSGVLRKAEALSKAGVDYDVFGLSYYMYWHGSLENLQTLMETIRTQYGKDVCVVETSYMFTGADGDGSGNSLDASDAVDGYALTPQGQADLVHDVCETTVKAGGIGVFYWEPAWIPVNYYKPGMNGAGAALEANQKAWRDYGSGWASEYAAGYDPKDAGRYYGGSSWDNQAWFDFEGKALPSLYTYRYLHFGSSAELEMVSCVSPEVHFLVGDALVMPETVEVRYNDRTMNGPASVTWDEETLKAIDPSVPGTYEVHGQLDEVEGEMGEVTCTIVYAYENLLKNPSLEEGESGDWHVEVAAGGSPVDYQQKAADASDGEMALHFWSSQDMDFTITQTLTAETDGTYVFTFDAQGGDIKTGDTFTGFVTVTSSSGEETTYEASFTLTGWVNWQYVVISDIKVSAGDSVTVGIHAVCSGGAWGTFDNFTLRRN